MLSPWSNTALDGFFSPSFPVPLCCPADATLPSAKVVFLRDGTQQAVGWGVHRTGWSSQFPHISGKAKNSRSQPRTERCPSDAQVSPRLQVRGTCRAGAVRPCAVSKESSAPDIKHRGESHPASVSSPHSAADS